jgi:hypothetical protein
VQITLKERIESIQVGSISALAFLVPYLLFLIVDRVFLGESITVIGTFVKISGAIISGFLFGVTYRYRKFGLKPRPFRTALSYNGKSDNQAKN